jgi:hypothetical protein
MKAHGVVEVYLQLLLSPTLSGRENQIEILRYAGEE